MLQLALLVPLHDRQAEHPPVRQPEPQAMGVHSGCPQYRDRLVRKHAVGAATVRDDLAVPRQRVEDLLQSLGRYRPRPGDVSRAVLLERADVQQDHLSHSDAPQQLVGIDRLQLVPLTEITAHQCGNLRQAPLTRLAHCLPETEYLVAGQPIVDPRPLSARLDQPGLREDAQVLRAVGDREPHLLRQVLDAPLTLRQQVEHLQPPRAGQRLPDPGELPIQLVLEASVRCSVEYSHDQENT